MRNDVLVGYSWCRSSYTAIRSLSRYGLRVAEADSARFGMGQNSRFISERYVHCDPRSNPEQFIEDMNKILRKSKVHFYLPGHDEGQIVTRYRKHLPRHIKIPLPSYNILSLANDKMRAIEFASRGGIPTPKYAAFKHISKIDNIISEIGESVVIKLHRSNSAKGVFYAQGKELIIDTLDKVIRQFNLKHQNYPIIQKRVKGEGWGVSCLYWHGNRIASFTHRRLREKISTGGPSTLRESAHNRVMEDCAHKLLDKLNWHGLAMVEFKWNPIEKQPWFIEINPRLWGSIALPVACGVDFPVMTYTAATKGIKAARSMYKDYPDGIVARWYLGDMIISIKSLSKLNLLEAMKLLLPGNEDVYDDLFYDDIGATFSEFLSYFLRFIKYRSTNPIDRGFVE